LTNFGARLSHSIPERLGARLRATKRSVSSSISRHPRQTTPRERTLMIAATVVVVAAVAAAAAVVVVAAAPVVVHVTNAASKQLEARAETRDRMGGRLVRAL
jgi:type VI protein secretion system component VasF